MEQIVAVASTSQGTDEKNGVRVTGVDIPNKCVLDFRLPKVRFELFDKSEWVAYRSYGGLADSCRSAAIGVFLAVMVFFSLVPRDARYSMYGPPVCTRNHPDDDGPF